MAKTIDFDGLLKDLFQENVPVKENVQEVSQAKRNGADFSKALGEIFQTEKKYNIGNSEVETENSAGCEHMNEDNNSSLQACNLYIFVRQIVMECFGMGYDYAFEDRNGTPMKSWFTIPEAIEAGKKQGYKLTIAEVRIYLDKLIEKRYIETDNYKYRRRVFYDSMEKFLKQYK